MRSLERVNIQTNVRTYSHTYVRDRPYIPSTTLLCEGIIKRLNQHIKGKSFHSLIAVEAVGVRVPLYLGHS